MKISKIVLIVIAIVIIGIVVLYAYESLVESSSSYSWIAAPSYPIGSGGTYGAASQACAVDAGYINCIGGDDFNGAPYNNVYSSAISSSGAGAWSTTSTSYPIPIESQSCVTYAGYAYCVGGIYDNAADDTGESYFAPISQTGTLGSWNSTRPYPVPIDGQYCAAASGYVYCVAGENETDGPDSTIWASAVWFAPISSSGIGAWKNSNPYPPGIFFPDCFATSTDIYCIGGRDNNNLPLNSVYYTSLSSSGVGPWKKTTNYPVSLSGQSCSISSNIIYCVGGESNSNSYSGAVYYATVSSTGISSWHKASGYPFGVKTTCVPSSTYLYCVGGATSLYPGVTSDVYYAPLDSISG